MPRPPKTLSASLAITDRLQEAFLERLAASAHNPDAVLKEMGISRNRLGGWILNPAFRAAFLVALDAYERLHAPAFLAHVREKAMGCGDDAAQWAKMYFSYLEKSPPVIVQSVEVPADDDPVPATPALDPEDEELGDLA